LQLEGDKVEKFIDRYVLEVATRTIGISEEPLQDLLIGIFLPLVVRIVAFPQGLLVERHELRGGFLE